MFNSRNPNRIKKPSAGEPFLWFVSLRLVKEMNTVVGPGPDGFDIGLLKKGTNPIRAVPFLLRILLHVISV